MHDGGGMKMHQFPQQIFLTFEIKIYVKYSFWHPVGSKNTMAIVQQGDRAM